MGMVGRGLDGGGGGGKVSWHSGCGGKGSWGWWEGSWQGSRKPSGVALSTNTAGETWPYLPVPRRDTCPPPTPTKAVASLSQEKDLTVHCEQDLGPIVLIRLHKWRLFLEDAWFCKDVRVTGPNGTLYRFPCYQWLEGVITVEFREGSGRIHPILILFC